MSASRSVSNVTINNISWKFSYATTISVLVIEFFLYSPLLSFGVFYLKFVDKEGFSEKDVLWIPIFFIAFWKLTNPWSKQLCDRLDDKFAYQKWLITISTLLLVTAITTSALVENLTIFTLIYGCLGGISTSFINAQIKISTYEDFQSKPRLLDGLRQLARCIGLFTIPHIIFHLSSDYDVKSTQIIYGMLLLNILPAGLLLTRIRRYQFESNLNRFKTTSGLFDDPNVIELSPIQKRFMPLNPDEEEEAGFNNKLHTLFNPDEDFEFSIYEEENNESNRNKTVRGVEIMPQIDEESETESEHVERRLTNGFLMNNGKDIFLNGKDIENCDKGSISSLKTNFFAKVYDCFSFEKLGHHKFTWRLKMKKFWRRNFTRPLKYSLRNFYFYPSLFTRTTVHFMSVIFIVTVPYLAVEKITYGDEMMYTELEGVFLLSLISFSWVFFLVTLFWMLNMSKTRISAINIIGLFICGLCFFLTSRYLTHVFITINVLIFGYGFGIITFTEDVIVRENIGLRQSAQIDKILNVLSAILMIIFYLVLYILDYTLVQVFGLFSQVWLVNLVLWVALPTAHFLWNYFNHYEQRGSLVFSNF